MPFVRTGAGRMRKATGQDNCSSKQSNLAILGDLVRNKIEKLPNFGISGNSDSETIRLQRTINGLNLSLFFVALFGMALLSFFGIGPFLLVVEITVALGYLSGVLSAFWHRDKAARRLFIYTFELNAFAVSLFVTVQGSGGHFYSPFSIGFVIFPFLALMAELSVILHAFVALFLASVLLLPNLVSASQLRWPAPFPDTENLYFCYLLCVLLLPFVGAILAATLGREGRAAKKKAAHANELLRISNQELNVKNREILEYTHAIVHDLKKPLSVISTTYQLMNGGLLADNHAKQREVMGLAGQSLEYMRTLLADLVESARQEAGASPLNKEQFQMAEVFSRVLSRLKPEIDGKGIRISLECEGSIRADPRGVEKVLMNLVGNAISYTGANPKPEIDIQCRMEKERILVSVKDTGIGIPLTSQGTIFEKFGRGSNTKGTQGTGLGLHISKSIIETHGGEIWFKSQEGRGTTFYFTLPREEPGGNVMKKNRFYDKYEELSTFLEGLKTMPLPDRDGLVGEILELINQRSPDLLSVGKAMRFPLQICRRRWYDRDPYLWLVFNAIRSASPELIREITDFFRSHWDQNR